VENMVITWDQERLKKLATVSNLTKIPRYFAIKKLVEEILEEEIIKITKPKK
jgi:hypothetical protein